MQVCDRGAESGGGARESGVPTGDGVTVCGCPPGFSLKRSGEEVDSLIDLMKHPAHVDYEKVRKMRLNEIEEELWMR